MGSAWILILTGGIIALISSVITLLLQHFLMIRARNIWWERMRREQEEEELRRKTDGYREVDLSPETLQQLAYMIQEILAAQAAEAQEQYQAAPMLSAPERR